MMAHVFNEIEHDIAYKPDGAGPRENEKALIASLGHLTRAGDVVVSQLLAANEERLKGKPGDFTDQFDFVARMRSEIPDYDFSGYSAQLFDELQALGIKSVAKLKSEIGKDRFNVDHAKEIIREFNSFMKKSGDRRFELDANSSDLVLALLLEKFAQKIQDNHEAGWGKGRPPRIRSIASRYLEYKQAKT